MTIAFYMTSKELTDKRHIAAAAETGDDPLCVSKWTRLTIDQHQPTDVPGQLIIFRPFLNTLPRIRNSCPVTDRRRR